MADVEVVSFVLGEADINNRVQVDIDVDVRRSNIEVRLGIPFSVHGFLIERDGSSARRDRLELEPYALVSFLGQAGSPYLRVDGDDDQGWGSRFSIGTVPGNAGQTHRLSASDSKLRSSLPNEWGNDEFYCAVFATPDIRHGYTRSGIQRIP
jgi:hypothetical protein